MSLLFNMLSRFFITFHPRRKSLFNFMAAVDICSDFGAQENKASLFSLFSHLFAMKWWGWMLWFVSWMLSFKPAFSYPSFTFIKRLFSSSTSVHSLSHVRLLATPWTAAYQAPLSMGFSKQEYWSGLPLPSPKHASTSAYSGISLVVTLTWNHRVMIFLQLKGI